MPVGGFYIDAKGLKELQKGLEGTARGVKDLSRLYGEMGRHAGLYAMAKEPVYGGPAKGRQVTIHLQDHTKGGGGKNAWARVTGVPYLILQEFGGSSFWSRSGAGSARAAKRALHVKTHAALVKAGAKGHIIYRKPKRARGYFIFNVWYELRGYVGEKLTGGLRDIGEKNSLHMDVTESRLEIPQKTGP